MYVGVMKIRNRPNDVMEMNAMHLDAIWKLLYQPQMIGEGDCGAIGGMKIGRGTEVLGENLPQRHIVHNKSHMTRDGLEPGPPRWEASD
jgi:hypothetical protein